MPLSANEKVDVLLVETGTGGDFVLKNNDLAPSYSIENLIPLYLFGGNIEQNTEPGDSENIQNFDWWGNAIEEDEIYNSDFERQLKLGVLSSAGVQALVSAAERDLAPLAENYDLLVSGSSPVPGRFKLEIELDGPSNKKIKKVYLFNGTNIINLDANGLANSFSQ